jgi:D-threo-aldose 1-dehydrogenase
VTDDLNTRRRVGATELFLPPFGLGTGPLGNLYSVIPETLASATLEAAWNSGVRFYDTAAWYGRGLSELRLGAFLRSKDRSEYVLVTKVGRTLRRPRDPRSFDGSPWAGGLGFEAVFDYSYDGVMRSYEQALQRLGIPEIDGLTIHDLDHEFHGAAFDSHRAMLLNGGMKAVGELKRTGEIKAIGCGFNTTDAMGILLDEIDIDYALVAHPYTLLDQSALRVGMPQCLARNISVVVGAPFASGILATGSGSSSTYAYRTAPPAIQDRVRRIEAICATHRVSLPSAALQFPLAHPAVVSVLAGAVKANEVEANAGHMGATIPVSLWSDLKAEGLIDADAPVPQS